MYWRGGVVLGRAAGDRPSGRRARGWRVVDAAAAVARCGRVMAGFMVRNKQW
jgi:hypothetical protein